MTGRLFNSGWGLLVARGSFLVALAGVATLALMPVPPQVPDIGGDKVEHFAAFFVLAVLGTMSWRRGHRAALAVGLIAFGATLELLQGTALIHRDLSVFDWLVDVVGVLAGVGCAVAFLRGVGISRAT